MVKFMFSDHNFLHAMTKIQCHYHCITRSDSIPFSHEFLPFSSQRMASAHPVIKTLKTNMICASEYI